eukprot:CAMPEP_0118658784 /NCGR_PEP_ID=MMETSP0785-20121206/14755_1 /TAXON_ID=91992 /ORGANISM="Bolidomonas pacifica, Strain CCMP 1866" /LENGTH=269 /DNA_ID=CAMNT_0006551829 /DNA_START=67 /DNA_END=873 /DNA_ORIENTATION=-
MRFTTIATILSAISSVLASPRHGPYNVTEEVATGIDYICGGDDGAVIYYPDKESASPLISFAHGYKAGGDKMDPSYKTLLEGVASWGYVVIALKSAPDEFCWDETTDQITSLQWIQTSKFAPIVDYEKKTGLMGHSMGGAATHLSAKNLDAVTTYNIGAAVALHPVYVAGSSNVPIFYGTGSNDTVVPPSSVKPQYSATNGVGKVYANIEGATHFEPNTVPPNRWVDFAAAFFDCYLQDSNEGCDTIFGSGESSLCSGDRPVPMEECIF